MGTFFFYGVHLEARPELGSNPDVNVHALIEATDTVGQLRISTWDNLEFKSFMICVLKILKSGCLFRNFCLHPISTGKTVKPHQWTMNLDSG